MSTVPANPKSLDPEVLLDFIARAAGNLRIDELDEFRRAGVFAINPSPAASIVGATNVVHAAWLPAFDALFEVFGDVRIDSGNRDEPHVIPVLRLPAAANLAAFCRDLVADFTTALKERVDASEDVKVAIDTTAAGLIVLSAALGQPDCVSMLVAARPSAIRVELNPEVFLGPRHGQSCRRLGGRKDGRVCAFTPAFFAFAYSAQPCVDVLLEAGWRPDGRVGGRYVIKSSDPEGRSSTAALSLLEVACDEVVLFLGPIVLGQMLQLARPASGFSPEDAKLLFEFACGVANWDSAHRDCLSAFVDVGAFDCDIPEALSVAAEEGASAIFDRYRDRMPWDDLFSETGSSVVHGIVDSCNVGMAPWHFDDLATIVMDRAVQDGRGAAMFDLRAAVSEDGPPEIAILGPAIRRNLTQVVKRFLEAGVDFNARVEGVASTPLEYVISRRPDMVDLVRSFSARKLTQDLIEQLDGPAAVQPR